MPLQQVAQETHHDDGEVRTCAGGRCGGGLRDIWALRRLTSRDCRGGSHGPDSHSTGPPARPPLASDSRCTLILSCRTRSILPFKNGVSCSHDHIILSYTHVYARARWQGLVGIFALVVLIVTLLMRQKKKPTYACNGTAIHITAGTAHKHKHKHERDSFSLFNTHAHDCVVAASL